jgi:hypothetical protein
MPFPCRAHAVPQPCSAAKGLECVFPIWFTQCGRVWFIKIWSVNQTRPHCVNQIGKTHSKPLAARHGRGTAWARHAMCESAFKSHPPLRQAPLIIYVWPFQEHCSIKLLSSSFDVICFPGSLDRFTVRSQFAIAKLWVVLTIHLEGWLDEIKLT